MNGGLFRQWKHEHAFAPGAADIAETAVQPDLGNQPTDLHLNMAVQHQGGILVPALVVVQTQLTGV